MKNNICMIDEQSLMIFTLIVVVIFLLRVRISSINHVPDENLREARRLMDQAASIHRELEASVNMPYQQYSDKLDYASSLLKQASKKLNP